MDNCDTNKSKCNLGGTFELPQGIEYKSMEAVNYLSGESSFTISEIEVYEIISNV